MTPGDRQTAKAPDAQKQYELVLQEYRFQVQLNWDRAKHFLIFNTAILAAAVALYKSGSTTIAKLGVAALLVLAATNSFVGRHAVEEGHKMYRSVRGTKTRLEKILNLGDLAIQSTAGMKREHDEALEGTPSTGKGRLSSITFQIQALLLLIAVVSALGAGYAVWEATAGGPPTAKAPAAPITNNTERGAAGESPRRRADD